MSVTICDERGDRGFSWTVDEPMQRTGHALVDRDRVWLVDPTDDVGALERAAALGRFAGVLQLLDRHGRDCAAIAARLEVPLSVCPDAIPDSPFQTIPLTTRRWWREVALWWPQERLMVVPEALGTNPFFTARRGSVGVHPLLRLTPPRALGGHGVRHLLVGHGAGVHGNDVDREISHAVADARRGIPGLVGTLLRRRGAPRAAG